MQEYKNRAWDHGPGKISVVILAFQEKEKLLRALSSLEKKEPRLELIVLANGASADVAEAAKAFVLASATPALFLAREGQRPGSARNFAARYARSPYLFFFDDDIELFQDSLAVAWAEFEKDPTLAVIGGANLTPPGSSSFEEASGDVFASFLGAMAMSRRYRQNEKTEAANEHALILCNLAVRKDLFKGFPLGLSSNEENVLLQEWERQGLKMIKHPSFAVYHYRRKNLAGLGSQCSKYGQGRAQNLFLQPGSLHPRYFLPALALLYSLLLPMLLFVSPYFLLPYGLYAGLAIVATAKNYFSHKNFSRALWQLFLYPYIHVAYAWGFLAVLLGWKKRAKQ